MEERHAAAWATIPLPIQDRIKRLLDSGSADAEAVVAFFLGEIDKQLPATQDTTAHHQSDGPSVKYEDVYEHVSQVIPTRKSVTVEISKRNGIRTSAGADMIEQGGWNTFNVFLQLPIPRRPRKQWNLVLTKLGGGGPFIVFTSSDPPDGLVSSLSRYTKYSDTAVEESRAVLAYIGAKEGLLYFLDDFIFYGFKKPLVLILLAEIDSVSFTLVTSRTFNIVVQLLDEKTYEFEKIPHESYNSILTYIHDNGLADESMAEARRAKRQRVEPTELEQATKDYGEATQSQEEEDAAEVDYVVGSDDDSSSGSDHGGEVQDQDEQGDVDVDDNDESDDDDSGRDEEAEEALE